MAKKILVAFSDQFLKELDALVDSGAGPSRSELIRLAIRQFLEKRKLEEIERKLKREESRR